MRVLGIDCGTARTGYGVVETPAEAGGAPYRLITYGAIRTGNSLAFPKRLRRIHDEVARLVAEHEPDSVAIEEVFYQLNPKSAIKLSHVRGVVMLAAASAGLPVGEYSPLEVKSAVVGYGRAEKEQVQHMVKTLLGLRTKVEPHDAADALAVAICHINTATTRQKLAAQTACSPRKAGSAVRVGGLRS